MRIWEIVDEQVREPALVVDPNAEADKREIYALIRKYKDTLGPRVSEMIDQRLEGKTNREIAAQFGISPERASELIQDGLKTIRDRMNLATNTDAGYLYGVSKDFKNSRFYAYSHAPHLLQKEIEGNPNLKIIRMLGSGYTVVHRDDPGIEVEHRPDVNEIIRVMKTEIANLKDQAERRMRDAERRDWQRRTSSNRQNLKRDPSYLALSKRISDLEARIQKVASRGTWQDKEPDNVIGEAEVWDKPNPKKTHSKLSPEKKAAAKRRAKAAGRPYPNLVDNMWASKK